MIKTVMDYNSVAWCDYFKLSDTSPSGLINSEGRLRCKVGDTAGCTGAGCTGAGQAGWRVRLNGKRYRVHRIIWCMTYGSVDASLVIDHLDGNPLNNKLNNLAIKTAQANSQNRKKSSANSSGITGVALETVGERSLWRAHWRGPDSVKGSKSFSIARYGCDEAKAMAIAYRKEQIELLNDQGQDYTERHMQNEIR